MAEEKARKSEDESPSLSDLEKGSNSPDYDQGSGAVTPNPEAQLDEKSTTRPNDEEAQSPPQPPPAAPDWDGPNDPENPMNWSLGLKAYHCLIPGLLCLVVTLGSSVYTAALPNIMQSFSTSRTVAVLPLTVYVLGLAFGPVIAAPISELYGRRVVYMTTPLLFMFFTLGSGFSQNLQSLIVCRFFAGFFGSPVLAVGAGTNADLFSPQWRAVATSLFILAPFAGPALGPVIGGFAAQYKGWRWTQWCLLFAAVPAFLITLPMKETYKKILLKKRAKKRNTNAPVSAPPALATIMVTLSITLVRPIHMLYTEPITLLLSLYTAYCFGILFCFFAAFPYIFGRPPYLFTASQTGLTFLSLGLGVALGSLMVIVVDRKIYQPLHAKALARGEQHVQPEQRLWACMMGSFGIPIGLFWFAWSAGTGTHWIVPLIGAVWFGLGNMSLFACTALYLVDVYGPLNGASALAANGILRYIFGAVFPLFTFQMYEKLGPAWATSLLAFLSILLLPIPFVFYKWGPDIRKRSQYPTAM